eukprot:359985-Chlamydomonas_euryale.AAC.21
MHARRSQLVATDCCTEASVYTPPASFAAPFTHFVGACGVEAAPPGLRALLCTARVVPPVLLMAQVFLSCGLPGWLPRPAPSTPPNSASTCAAYAEPLLPPKPTTRAARCVPHRALPLQDRGEGTGSGGELPARRPHLEGRPRWQRYFSAAGVGALARQPSVWRGSRRFRRSGRLPRARKSLQYCGRDARMRVRRAPGSFAEERRCEEGACESPGCATALSRPQCVKSHTARKCVYRAPPACKASLSLPLSLPGRANPLRKASAAALRTMRTSGPPALCAVSRQGVWVHADVRNEA